MCNLPPIITDNTDDDAEAGIWMCLPINKCKVFELDCFHPIVYM